jgi:hypothetical protein
MAISIAQQRIVNAESAFSDYDFEDEIVTGVNGWSTETDSDECSRVFFLAPEEDDDENDDDNEPSSREVFIVRFAPNSATIIEAFVRD